jgi:SAM-dependent methyltransferase
MADLPFVQAAENNKGPILEVLRPLLTEVGLVLEVGSGTGQHAVHFATHLPHLVWQPTERADQLPVLSLRLEAEAPDNVRAAVALDVADDPWQVPMADAVYAANAVHIMSWAHVEALFRQVPQILRPGGYLILYGPYKYNGAYTTQSNAAFDQWLKERDSLSGIRDFEALDALAQAAGLKFQADHGMPANNQCIVWRRTD